MGDPKVQNPNKTESLAPPKLFLQASSLDPFDEGPAKDHQSVETGFVFGTGE